MTPATATESLRSRVLRGGREFRVALAEPVSLARAVEFHVEGGGLRFFGAPPATSNALQVGPFLGAVERGASCNCATLTLTPHCHGTHTECLGHLTAERIDAWRIVPRGLMNAVLVTAKPEERVVSRAALAAALQRTIPAMPPMHDVTALILRTGCADDAMAHLSPDAAALLVEHGILHVVLDMASMDPAEDGGELAAHRVFFGLPARHRDGSVTRALEARAERSRCSITELARIPPELADGACLLQLAVPELDGDAVPSSPLLYPLVPA